MRSVARTWLAALQVSPPPTRAGKESMRPLVWSSEVCCLCFNLASWSASPPTSLPPAVHCFQVNRGGKRAKEASDRDADQDFFGFLTCR